MSDKQRFGEMTPAQRLEDLIERTALFHLMQLPGQPMGMHMGTSRLVSDLLNEVRRLAAASSEDSTP